MDSSYSYSETIIPVRVLPRSVRVRKRQAHKGNVGMGKIVHGVFVAGLALAVICGTSGIAVLAAAFESHIINVTASISQIDPPVLTPPGDIGWNVPDGGTNLTAPLEVVMTDVATLTISLPM